jgi:hypothetical protein
MENNYDQLKKLLVPYHDIKLLEKELDEDSEFNVVDRIQKIQELPHKYVKWIVRLRNAQTEYNDLFYEKEEIRSDIAKVIEGNIDGNVTQMTIMKGVDAHPLWNAYNKKISQLKVEIAFLKNAVEGMTNLGHQFRELNIMLNQERL